LLALNDALYATPEQRRLHDIMTCIREKRTVMTAGKLLAANAERHLKPPAEMARLFADAPAAIDAVQTMLDRVEFTLDQLRYEYPDEPVPSGYMPQQWLEALTLTKARERWPEGVPERLHQLLADEFAVIERMDYARYFLTVHDIVAFAQAGGILCQGRGSAANSTVVSCLASPRSIRSRTACCSRALSPRSVLSQPTSTAISNTNGARR
jgi:error-prone DNA polymerase